MDTESPNKGADASESNTKPGTTTEGAAAEADNGKSKETCEPQPMDEDPAHAQDPPGTKADGAAAS